MPLGTDIGSLLTRVQEPFPETTLVAKREYTPATKSNTHSRSDPGRHLRNRTYGPATTGPASGDVRRVLPVAATTYGNRDCRRALTDPIDLLLSSAKRATNAF